MRRLWDSHSSRPGYLSRQQGRLTYLVAADDRTSNCFGIPSYWIGCSVASYCADWRHYDGMEAGVVVFQVVT